MAILTRRDVYSTIIRSFFIQAVWNYERMLNIGFAFCLIPAARRFVSRATVSSFLSRHLGFFNANPFIATMAIGAVVKLEETGTSEEEIDRFKQALCGPLGAVGDRTFWGVVRPVSAAIGTIVALIGGGWWGAAIFLIVFNLIQTIVRRVAFVHGYGSGFAVARMLSGPPYREMEVWGRRLGGLLLGFLIVTAFVIAGRTSGGYHIAILIGATLTGMIVMRRNLPMSLFFPLCIAGVAIILRFLPFAR